MNANFERIAKDLVTQLSTRFPSMRKETIDSKPIDGRNFRDQDTRKLSFDYTDDRNGEKLTNVSISLSDADEKPAMSVLWSKNPRDESWMDFLDELSDFAQTHGLDFDLQNPSQSNLDKRDPIGEGRMTESRLSGTSKTSYQDIGEAKIIVRHSSPVNYNAPNGRTQHIDSIFIENAVGERFKYPYKHLNGARALAEHIKNGGTPYDAIGSHITGLSEELASLRKFKGYVGRNAALGEAMGDITSKVMERIEEVKHEIHSLQRPAYYSHFAENFQARESQNIPEDVMNDWIDRLTIRTFNEEMKSVFPFIYNLVGETNLPVRNLSADDLLGEEYEEEDTHQSKLKDSIESQFEREIDSIVREDDDLYKEDEVGEQAMQTLKDLFKQELPIGTNGNNVTSSLRGTIDNNKLDKAFELLADLGLDELDARPIISAFLKSYDSENETDLATTLGFDAEGAAPAAETPPVDPAAPPVDPAAAPVDPAAAAPVDPAAAAPVDPAAAAPVDPAAVPPAPAAPVAETSEDYVSNQPRNKSNVAEKLFSDIKERVSGFFNSNEGTMTIGEAGFVTKMCKELKEKYNIEPDSAKADKFDGMVERACYSVMEKYKTHNAAKQQHDRMMELAGIVEASDQTPYYVDMSSGKPMAKTGGRGLTAIVPSNKWTAITPEIEAKADAQGFRKVTLQAGGKTFVGLEGGDQKLGSKIIVAPSDFENMTKTGTAGKTGIGIPPMRLPSDEKFPPMRLPKGDERVFPPMRLPSDEKFPPMRLPKGDERVFPPMRLPTNESADDQLLKNMLTIAGLK
jgi:hypothetical protein